jgi:uncharacterized membrane protein
MTTTTMRHLQRTSERIPSVLKIVGWSLMSLLALVLFARASMYLTLNPDVYFDRQRVVYMAHTFAITTHVGAAMLAAVIGPFQFLPKITSSRYLNLHRWLGRVYVAGVLIGGIAGLYMSFFAHGGLPARVGFATLACVWLLCGFTAYRRIRSKDIQSHRQWMIRTYALTFAAVTLRLWLIGFEVRGVNFVESYATVAWLSWVPNLLIAEWIVHRIRPDRRRAVTTATVKPVLARN